MTGGAVLSQFHRGEAEAVQLIDDWIARAAAPYRRKLASNWDDLMQDIRLRLLTHAAESRLRKDASWKSYVWKMVNSMCIDQIRKQKTWRYQSLTAPTSDEDHPWPTPELAEPEGWQHALYLLDLLDKVPPLCRQLWRLILAGYSYRQMSLAMDMSPGALRVKVFRCRKQAAELLGATEAQDGEPS